MIGSADGATTNGLLILLGVLSALQIDERLFVLVHAAGPGHHKTKQNKQSLKGILVSGTWCKTFN
jgi:hypothetical protein